MRPSATFLVSLLGCSLPHYCLLSKQTGPVPEGLLSRAVPSQAGTNRPPLTVLKYKLSIFNPGNKKVFHMSLYRNTTLKTFYNSVGDEDYTFSESSEFSFKQWEEPCQHEWALPRPRQGDSSVQLPFDPSP
ncbi:hypothetical protein L3Q82_022503 [Scortum barcoo]|uniref:Uncharacterized protein n=1 Tax=Scortum barcoo TaxID=214431 RepID=A0ACB8X1I4_9TELE|nr:hypothetical protein L3Q82_022503 [Scortum barcoo]